MVKHCFLIKIHRNHPGAMGAEDCLGKWLEVFLIFIRLNAPLDCGPPGDGCTEGLVALREMLSLLYGLRLPHLNLVKAVKESCRVGSLKLEKYIKQNIPSMHAFGAELCYTECIHLGAFELHDPFSDAKIVC